MVLHEEFYAIMGQRINSVSRIALWLVRSLDLSELVFSPIKWEQCIFFVFHRVIARDKYVCKV